MAQPIDEAAVREAALRTWASSPDLRAEFRDNEAAFVAYRIGCARGQIKILSGDAPAPAAEVSDIPAEERCRRAWASSAKLQAEYGGNFNAYLAYTEASEKGLARIYRRDPA